MFRQESQHRRIEILGVHHLKRMSHAMNLCPIGVWQAASKFIDNKMPEPLRQLSLNQERRDLDRLGIFAGERRWWRAGKKRLKR